MRKKVVIVEDNRPLRNQLVKVINNSKNYECLDHFGNAELALQIIPKLKPDLVLMDIELPKMDGIACTVQLKRDDPNLLILMLTSFEDTERVFNALKAGACGYLLKSDTTVDKLLGRMDEAFQGGSPMTCHIARKVVQYFHSSNQAIPMTSTTALSTREKEILELLSTGLIYKEIGSKLDISPETVRSHVKNICEKLHVSGRTEAVSIYSRQLK